MSSTKFDYLLIGLKEYLDSKQKYPYPDLLHQGMNALSLEIKKSISFPKTMQGFFKRKIRASNFKRLDEQYLRKKRNKINLKLENYQK